MIQRIQSVYLFVAIALLVIISCYGNFFEIITDEGRFAFNALGMSQYTTDGKELIRHTSIPLIIVFLALAAFGLLILFSYKQLRKQLNYAKLFWGLYLLSLIGVIVWFYFIATSQVSGEIVHSNYDVSFYLLVIGLPCTHLAYINIRKDKQTIDSLNRLR